MMFYEKDIDVFFKDFAIEAGYTTQGGLTTTIKVIFDNNFQTIEMLTGGVGVESQGIFANCRTSDVLNAKHGDTLIINGKTYYVVGVEPDGTGITRLRLSEDWQ